MSVCPCKTCTQRYKACHATCEAYKADREEALKRKEAIRKQKDTENFMFAVMKKRNKLNGSI